MRVASLEGETTSSGSPVVVSSATADLLRDPNTLRPLGSVSIRGKEQSMRIFTLAKI